MIIVRVSGGLGNQMFQYALGRAVSLKYDVPLKLDNYMQRYLHESNAKIFSIVFRDYELDVFNIQAEIAEKKEIPWWLRFYGFGKYEPYLDGVRRRTVMHRGRERGSAQIFDPSILSVGKNAYLDGDWQSYKYFENIAPILRQDFQIKVPLSKEVEALRAEIVSKNSLCIHVRRGDYVGNAFHGLRDQAYYDLGTREIEKCGEIEKNNEIGKRNEIEKNKPIEKIYVFSDDISWCQENLSFAYETMFVGQEFAGAHQMGHFLLMRSCKHFIICNSSYSWWAAWLAESPSKIVVAPKQWFSDTSINTTDLIPPEWIRV